MEDKKIDNTITLNNKKKLEDYDNQINENKKIIKHIEELQGQLYSINNKLNKCGDLVNKSLVNKKINKKIDSYQTESKIEFDRIMYTLDEKKDSKVKENKKLKSQSEELMNEVKKENNKE